MCNTRCPDVEMFELECNGTPEACPIRLATKLREHPEYHILDGQVFIDLTDKEVEHKTIELGTPALHLAE